MEAGYFPNDQPSRTAAHAALLEVPRYSVAEAARLLRLPQSTLRWWLRGRTEGDYRPVLETVHPTHLDFLELCELAVIKELRRVREVSLSTIRRALDFAAKQNIERVLLSDDLRVFHDYLILASEDEAIAISAGGQLALKELIERFSHRIRHEHGLGLPDLLHPSFHAEQKVDNRPPVSISPLISWGQPVLTGTGIKTGVIAAHAAAGNTVAELAWEFDVEPALIENAVLYEYVT